MGTATRLVARPRPLAAAIRSGSSQTIRSTAALIDPAVLTRDDSKGGPALHAAENLNVLLRGDKIKPNARNEFTETAVTDAPTLHGRSASIALTQPEFTEVEAADHAWRQTNHIWSDDELEKVSVEKHQLVTMPWTRRRGPSRGG